MIEIEPLRCLLLPTQGWTFILPCATVAEIVPYEREGLRNPPLLRGGEQATENKSRLCREETSGESREVLQSLKKIKEMPEWLLGMFEWRGLMIPLLSLELINQSFANIQTPNRAHIAVLNRTAAQSKLDYYGILLNGVPRMGLFRPPDITLTTTCLEPHLSMEVEVLKEKSFIPNLDWIEERVNSLPNLPQDTAKL